MKNALVMMIAIALVLSALFVATSGKSQTSTSRANQNAQPVIVELFTSEGCSSCPPADALLMELEAKQPVLGAKVIALEEHVDYWNQQGWKDPYSSADWTLRQVQYVSRFKDKEPYTPEMIVEGESQVVGSRQLQAEQAIQQVSTQPKTQITLAPDTSSPGESQQFKVTIGKLVGYSDHDSAEVWLAVTESGLASSVNAGENAGKDLHHASVLRSLRKLGVASQKGDSAFESSPRVKFNSGWKRQNLQVVVFVQEKKSMRILGATAVGVAS
jgi:hypothetical protein